MSYDGLRNDLIEAKAKILGKRKIADLYADVDLVETMAKFPRWARSVHALRRPDREVTLDLRPWQVEVLAILDKAPTHRQIIWIWSETPGTEKTTFFDYCCLKYDVLPAQGRNIDYLQAYDSQDIIWYDYTRAQKGYESYRDLEKFSNHSYQLSTKGDVLKKYVQSHVVVTANWPPTSLLERAKVYCIDPVEPVSEVEYEVDSGSGGVPAAGM